MKINYRKKSKRKKAKVTPKGVDESLGFNGDKKNDNTKKLALLNNVIDFFVRAGVVRLLVKAIGKIYSDYFEDD